MKHSFINKNTATAQPRNCNNGFECFELALKELEQAKKEIRALEKRLEDRVKEAETKANTAQTTANDAVNKANTAQTTANVYANSQVLNEFIKHTKYSKRGSYHFFEFPNIEAWDVRANGQFYSGHGFVSTEGGKTKLAVICDKNIVIKSVFGGHLSDRTDQGGIGKFVPQLGDWEKHSLICP